MNTLIFDLGVVLLDVDYQKTIDAFGELGLPNPGEAFSKHHQDPLFRQLERGQISPTDFLSELGHRMSINDRNAIEAAWCAMLGKIPQRKFDLLQQLSANHDLYILSNTNALHRQHFEQTIDRQYGWEDFEGLFEFIGYSHEMGSRKPEPEIYDKLINEWSIDLDRALFIDDTEVNVEGARRRGIRAVHYEAKDDLAKLIESCR